MEKRNTGSFTDRVWNPTGRYLNGRQIYKSILGHFAIELDGRRLTSPKEAGICSVCGIVHGEGWKGECHAAKIGS